MLNYFCVLSVIFVVIQSDVEPKCALRCHCLGKTVNCYDLSVIPRFNIFVNRVTELNMTSNFLETIQDDLEGYGSLSRLILKNNTIGDIHPQAFQGLTDLKYLDLSGNKITSFSKGTFDYIPSVTILLLSNNNIVDIEEHTFSKLTELTNLDFSYNLLRDISVTIFSHNEKMELLSLKNNSISQLQKLAFQFQRQLQHLDLSENKISSLHPETFNDLKNLKWLSLSQNNINHLQNQTFSDQDEVLHLNLTGNRISEINSRTFSSCLKLVNLSLSHNNINKLYPLSFYGLFLMENLDLSFNNISSLDGKIFAEISVSVNYTLKYLNLENNVINYLAEDLFDSLNNIRHINIARNHLFSLDYYGLFSRMNDLSILDVSFNNITKFDERTAHWLNKTSVNVVLTGNTWNCSCESLYEMYKLLSGPPKNITIICYAPEEIHNLPWDILKNICRTSTTITTWTPEVQVNYTTSQPNFENTKVEKPPLDQNIQKSAYAPYITSVVLVSVFSLFVIIFVTVVIRYIKKHENSIVDDLWWEDAVTRKDLLS